ncbi:hypothetical protein FPV67DRAFT_1625361 [Lyophyllum atratum]|nr:hypothetical protein FPV67DRAFT_1625361 [Lyophyllum atratum]
MSRVQLMNLPIELVCYILSFLDSIDLIQCTLLAKRLHKVILDSSRLQYTIELAKHRMVSLLPPSAAPPYASRLKILHDREQAWKTLSWNGRYTLKLPPTGSVYEFVGGLYGNGKEDDRRVTASISFLELPSGGGDGGETSDVKTWTHPMADIIIIDFTMDPSQDLLVLIALATPGSKYVYELHLRSLSTNEPHPKATLPTLPCLLKPSHADESSDHIAAVRVQVSGDLVALLVKEVHEDIGAHLEIWDWIHNPQTSCKMSRNSGIDDFTFLSSSAFLLVRPTGTFEVYTFPNPIPSDEDEDAAPVCKASYQFPPLSEGYMYWYITMSSNPAPGSIPRPGPDAHLGGEGGPTYYPEPEERIHACCLYVFNPATEDTEHRVHCFVFFVNIQTLLHPPAEWLQKATPRYNRSRARMRGYSASSDSDTPSSSTIGSGGSSNTTTPFTSPPYIPHTSYIYFPLSPPTPPLPFPSQAQPYPPHPHATLLPLRPPTPTLITPKTTHAAPIHIPWAAWGPQSTRWFQECLSTDWQHSIWGLRTIESVLPERVGAMEVEVDESVGMGRGMGLVDGGREEEEAGAVGEGASSSAATTPTSAPSPDATPTAGAATGPDAAQPVQMDYEERPSTWRHLRLRDYNPYAVMAELTRLQDPMEHRTDAQGKDKGKGKGKGKGQGKESRRVVTEPSTTNVWGVFQYDVESWLPYVECVSEEVFEVTDVMMDDCRVLLLKVSWGPSSPYLFFLLLWE